MFTQIYQESSPKMKQAVRIVVILLLLGLVAGAFAFAKNQWKSAYDKRQERQISVTGEGTATARPDISVFTVGIITQSAKIGEAQLENTRRSGAVIGFLKNQDIEEKDIKTVSYRVSPQYQYDREIQCLAYPCPPRNPPRIVSYEVRHMIEVKVRDLEGVDKVLGGVVDQGANEVGSVSFKVDDEDKVIAEARKKAIEDAKEKAKVISKDLGIRLKRIVGFSESGGGIPIFARTAEFGIAAAVSPAPAGPKIEPGEQEVRAFVTITYEFR